MTCISMETDIDAIGHAHAKQSQARDERACNHGFEDESFALCGIARDSRAALLSA